MYFGTLATRLTLAARAACLAGRYAAHGGPRIRGYGERAATRHKYQIPVQSSLETQSANQFTSPLLFLFSPASNKNRQRKDA